GRDHTSTPEGEASHAGAVLEVLPVGRTQRHHQVRRRPSVACELCATPSADDRRGALSYSSTVGTTSSPSAWPVASAFLLRNLALIRLGETARTSALDVGRH